MKWQKATKENIPSKIKGVIFRQVSSKIVLSESTVIDWIEDNFFHDLEFLDESPSLPAPTPSVQTGKMWREVLVSERLPEELSGDKCWVIDKDGYKDHHYITYVRNNPHKFISWLEPATTPAEQGEDVKNRSQQGEQC